MEVGGGGGGEENSSLPNSVSLERRRCMKEEVDLCSCR